MRISDWSSDVCSSDLELDNTLVIVTSDNGASAEGGLGGLYSMMRGANGEPPTFEENFARIDRWGGPGVQGHYHAGWASAGNTPFRYYKDRKSTRLNSSHYCAYRMTSSA